MKFTLTLNVTSDKSGLDLVDEYNRIFPGALDSAWENLLENEFGTQVRTLEVTPDFVRKHREIFENGRAYHAVVIVDSALTDPSDWDDYGSLGWGLHQDLSAERIIELRDRSRDFYKTKSE